MKKELSLGTVVVRNEQIPSAVIDEEVALMSIETGKYYAVNSVASDIWRILEKPSSVDELITSLTSEYDVDNETCTAQVIPFLEKLISEGLILIK